MPSDRPLPLIHRELVVQQMSDAEFVVKLRVRREYFSVGPEEAFLLEALKEQHTAASLSQAFAEKFGSPLSDEDVDAFVELVKHRRLLQGSESLPDDASTSEDDDEDDLPANGRQTLLYFRKSLCDPNETLAWLEPRFRWLWTWEFLVVSAGLMLLALLVVWNNCDQLVSTFPQAMGWETVAIGWVVVVLATAMHELAHGLTCKHFGGDVHESGVLVMFFMPCLYCNVSDAWMIREKWKRMLITAAGGYCDLCLWALAVFVWRMTVQDNLPNFVAFVILTVCGTRGLINVNPLLRLDGYYLLSDWLGIANLRKQAREYWMSHVRWLLWGADRPQPQPRSRVLLIYGLLMWVFAIWALDLIVLNLVKFAGDTLGVAGLVLGGLLLLYAIRRVFKGFFRSEFMNMLKYRQGRVARWVIGIAAMAGVSFLIPVRHYATGNFEVRPGTTHQVQAPVTAFVRNVFVEEGAAVTEGTPLVALESPDLANQIAVKRAELRESEANLTKLRAGARPEEIADQRERVARLQAWHRLGEAELVQARRRLEHELIAFEQRVEQSQAELELLQSSLQQSEQLYRLGALAGAELRSERTQLTVLRSQLRQAEADRSAREAEGVRLAEAELSQRMQQLADAAARLDLLLAGTRPEDISAEEARRQRLDEELRHLLARQEQLVVRAPAAGLVSMHRIRELIGSLATQGTPLCTIEDGSHSFIEISVNEEDVVGLEPGLPVTLKARAIPFETFHATLERIAPSTARSAAPTTSAPALRPTLVCYCQLDNADGRLRTGMSGFGRVSRGWKTLGLIGASKSLKYLRTEFWW